MLDTPGHVRARWSEPCEVIVTPNLGVLERDVHAGSFSFSEVRPKRLTGSFPEMFIHELGPATFTQGVTPLLEVDGTLVLEQSIHVESAGRPVQSVVQSMRLARDLPTVFKGSVDGPVFVACNEGSGTWGHWLCHTAPKVLIFLERYPSGHVVVPAFYFYETFRSFSDFASSLGVDEESLIPLEDRERLSIENAVLVDFPYRNGVFHPIALDLLRSRLAVPLAMASGQRIWIDRPDSTRREIVNMHCLDETLVQQPYVRFRNGDCALPEQMATFAGASVVAGVQGSDFANMIFSAGVRLAVLSPAWFEDVFFFGLAAQLELEWNELVCHQMVAHRQPINACSFAVDPESFNRFLAKVA